MRSTVACKSLTRAALGVAVLAITLVLVPRDAFAQVSYPPPYVGGYVDSSLRVLVKPDTASVFIDGYFAGRVEDFDGTFQRLHLEPGQHDVVIYLEGYRSLREHLYFSPNQTRKISAKLEKLGPGEPDEGPPVPTANTGRPGPFVDGRAGEPPAGPPSRRGPPPPNRGPAPGPGPDGQTPPPARSTASTSLGTLSIRVQPGNAEVTIDGERWTTESDDERLLVQLAAGRHVVEVYKPGYRRFTTEIQLRAGETSPVNISLTPDR